VLKEILQLERIVGFLRSNADLATNLLLNRPYISKIGDVTKYIFTCGKYQYTHRGSRNYAYLASQNILHDRSCPQYGGQTGVISKQHSYEVGLVGAFSYPSCDGLHTTEPIPKPQPLTEDVGG
jgi:hypothetical protein